MKTVAIIQARMSSSRLPGKVLLEISKLPMIEWVVERTQRAKRINQVVVATTIDRSDDPVFEFCRRKDYQVSRGSVHDVLDRYYQTAKKIKADVIVRITADCPLIDPSLIDQALILFFSENGSLNIDSVGNKPYFDFIANRLPPPWGRTFPIGLDIEVFTFQMLEQAKNNANSKYQLEHVTPYFYEHVPADQLKYQVLDSPYSSVMTEEGHHIALLHHTPDYGHLRWTVDTTEDLELVRKIVSFFPNDDFTWHDVLSLVQNKPELSQINAQVLHKTHLDFDIRSS